MTGVSTCNPHVRIFFPDSGGKAVVECVFPKHHLAELQHFRFHAMRSNFPPMSPSFGKSIFPLSNGKMQRGIASFLAFFLITIRCDKITCPERYKGYCAHALSIFYGDDATPKPSGSYQCLKLH
jgi:hypothetical protein